MQMLSRKCLLFAALVALLTAGSASAYNTTQTVYSDWRFSDGLMYGFSGDNHVYDYASYVDFYEGPWADGGLGGTWLGTGSREPHEMHWNHMLPTLAPPNDRVTRARLWIDASFVDAGNNLVSIGGTWDWDPLNHTFLDNTTYNLGSIDNPDAWNNGLLAVTIQAGENRLRVDRAVLMMDYESGSGAVATPDVPEPASLVLFGSGLIGFGALIRRRRNGRQ